MIGGNSIENGVIIDVADSGFLKKIKTGGDRKKNYICFDAKQFFKEKDSSGNTKRICVMAADALPFRKKSLDIIFIKSIWNMLNTFDVKHQENIKSLLSQIHVALKEKGQLVIESSPNKLLFWDLFNQHVNLKKYRNLLIKSGFDNLRFFWLHPDVNDFTWAIPANSEACYIAPRAGMIKIIFRENSFIKKLFVNLLFRLNLSALIFPVYTIICRKSVS